MKIAETVILPDKVVLELSNTQSDVRKKKKVALTIESHRGNNPRKICLAGTCGRIHIVVPTSKQSMIELHHPCFDNTQYSKYSQAIQKKTRESMTPASQISIIISAISMILSGLVILYFGIQQFKNGKSVLLSIVLAALGMIFVLIGIAITVLTVYPQAFGISLN